MWELVIRVSIRQKQTFPSSPTTSRTKKLSSNEDFSSPTTSRTKKLSSNEDFSSPTTSRTKKLSSNEDFSSPTTSRTKKLSSNEDFPSPTTSRTKKLSSNEDFSSPTTSRTKKLSSNEDFSSPTTSRTKKLSSNEDFSSPTTSRTKKLSSNEDFSSTATSGIKKLKNNSKRPGDDDTSLDLQIDGSLDLPLDPSWYIPKNTTTTKTEAPKITVLHSPTMRGDSWQKVKDNVKITEFTVHVYKQTMKVFNSLKKKITRTDIREKVDRLARSYRDKFTDFVQETRDTDIRTRSGDQKVILHTIDTSNLILQRLVNFLKIDMAKLGIFGVGEQVLQKEVDIERALENRHVCVKYGFCRTSGFRSVLQNMIKILLDADDAKLRQATDALSEVLKNGNYSSFLDEKTSNKFNKDIDMLETVPTQTVTQALKVVLGVLSKSEMPIVVSDGSSPVVAKTETFYNIMDTVEKALPPNEENTLVWNDTLNMLNEWKKGQRKDILEIIQSFEANVVGGINKMNSETKEKIKKEIKSLCESE